MRIVMLLALLSAVVVGSSFVAPTKESESAGIAQAQSTSEQIDTEMVSSGYFAAFAPIVRMVAALIIVILCIYGGLFMLRKMMGRRNQSFGSSESLRVLQTAYLAPRRSVSLVKVANRAVLIGVTDNHLSILTELSEEETQEVESTSKQKDDPEMFERLFNRAMTRIRELKPGRQTALSSSQ